MSRKMSVFIVLVFAAVLSCGCGQSRSGPVEATTELKAHEEVDSDTEVDAGTEVDANADRKENKDAAITIEALINANKKETLLDRHDSFSYSKVFEPGSVNNFTLYASRDLVYCKYNESAEDGAALAAMRDQKNSFSKIRKDGKEEFFYDWYAMSEEEKKKEEVVLSDAWYFIEPVTTCLEKIIDIKDNHDGTTTITSKMEADDFAEYFKEAVESGYMDYEDVYENAYTLTTYTVDSESLEIQAYTERFLHEDGSKFEEHTVTVHKDADQPEELTEMIAMADDMLGKKPADPRTLTVIYDYGTDQEETYSLTVDRKYKVNVYPKENYELYADSEKKALFEAPDGIGDVTIYAFKQ